MERFELTAVFTPEDDGWVMAQIAELPGVITQGRDIAEAKAMLADAFREYMLALGAQSPPAGSGPGAERLPLAISVDV